ncbi:acyltransferase [Streptomyces mashuensis]|uniref:Acyltransferase n=1 Tax=Streptomyces mashuensis TaxID=33904 RepID=A0A919B8M0_9ACTN|nr:acyltransferase [Streptomyces mashuensis]GHF64267.1 acyltransferase [Streptomyces mashuensis]
MRFARRGPLDDGRITAPGAPPRLYALDGFRLVAALLVVFYHYLALKGGWGHSPKTIFPTLHKYAQYGWVGVEIFFLISGFVICMSTWGRTLGDFVISRASRLYPGYWAAVLITAGVIITWPQVRQVHDLDVVLTNLTMLQQGLGVWDVDGVYWTLFTELKFYLLFAVVVAMGVTYRRCVLFCGVWTVAAVIAPSVNNKLLTTWAMPLFAPYFVAGIAFYLMYRYRPTAVLWGIVGISFLLADHHMIKRVKDNVDPGAPYWPARLMVLVAFVIMAMMANGWFNRIQWRWLTTAGALTYPLYLLHQYIGLTIIYALRDRVPAPLLVAGLVVVMLGAAWLMQRYIEVPLGKKLRTALKKGMAEIRLHTPAPRSAEHSGRERPAAEDRTPAQPHPYEPVAATVPAAPPVAAPAQTTAPAPDWFGQRS